MSENIKDWIKTISTAVISVAIITQFVMPANVYGRSMEPNFHHKDYLFINRQAYNEKRLPQRGDVILFKSNLIDEKGKNKILIKRVIGLPGETVAVSGGRVYINGQIIEEEYIKDGYTTGYVEPMEIPEGGYFCMGDNRVRSRDSRDEAVGVVSKDTILGEVFFRVFPFDVFGKTELK